VPGSKQEQDDDIYKIHNSTANLSEPKYIVEGNQEKDKDSKSTVQHISGTREKLGNLSHKINPRNEERHTQARHINGEKEDIGEINQLINGSGSEKESTRITKPFLKSDDFSDFEKYDLSSSNKLDDDDEIMKVERNEIVNSNTGGKGPMTLGGSGKYGSKISFSERGAVKQKLKKRTNS
jgi:hypothetical protein